MMVRSITHYYKLINEIERQERYKIKNAFVTGICSCYNKPSRSIMQLLLKPIVEQSV